MGGEILAVTGSQSPALLSSARRSVLDRATAPQSSALRNPDTRWGSHGDLRPLMGAEVVTPEEPHPFAADLVAHGGDPELITRTRSNMSNAVIAGVGDNLPNAEMTFDRFHVMKLLSEAVDDVRRVEQRDNPLLKKTRYIWLKNEPNLTAKQKETRAWLTRPSMRLATARALRWREDFQAFYDQPQQ